MFASANHRRTAALVAQQLVLLNTSADRNGSSFSRVALLTTARSFARPRPGKLSPDRTHQEEIADRQSKFRHHERHVTRPHQVFTFRPNDWNLKLQEKAKSKAGMLKIVERLRNLEERNAERQLNRAAITTALERESEGASHPPCGGEEAPIHSSSSDDGKSNSRDWEYFCRMLPYLREQATHPRHQRNRSETKNIKLRSSLTDVLDGVVACLDRKDDVRTLLHFEACVFIALEALLAFPLVVSHDANSNADVWLGNIRRVVQRCLALDEAALHNDLLRKIATVRPEAQCEVTAELLAICSHPISRQLIADDAVVVEVLKQLMDHFVSCVRARQQQAIIGSSEDGDTGVSNVSLFHLGLVLRGLSVLKSTMEKRNHSGSVQAETSLVIGEHLKTIAHLFVSEARVTRDEAQVQMDRLQSRTSSAGSGGATYGTDARIVAPVVLKSQESARSAAVFARPSRQRVFPQPAAHEMSSHTIVKLQHMQPIKVSDVDDLHILELQEGCARLLDLHVQIADINHDFEALGTTSIAVLRSAFLTLAACELVPNYDLSAHAVASFAVHLMRMKGYIAALFRPEYVDQLLLLTSECFRVPLRRPQSPLIVQSSRETEANLMLIQKLLLLCCRLKDACGGNSAYVGGPSTMLMEVVERLGLDQEMHRADRWLDEASNDPGLLEADVEDVKQSRSRSRKLYVDALRLRGTLLHSMLQMSPIETVVEGYKPLPFEAYSDGLRMLVAANVSMGAAGRWQALARRVLALVDTTPNTTHTSKTEDAGVGTSSAKRTRAVQEEHILALCWVLRTQCRPPQAGAFERSEEGDGEGTNGTRHKATSMYPMDEVDCALLSALMVPAAMEATFNCRVRTVMGDGGVMEWEWEWGCSPEEAPVSPDVVQRVEHLLHSFRTASRRYALKL